MNDVNDLIAAFVAIAKDPKAWDKRIADNNEAAGKLSEIRKLNAQAKEHAAQAASDLETARYERGQADHRHRETLSVQQAIEKRDQEVAAREKAVAEAERAFEFNKAQHLAAMEARDTELKKRELEVERRSAETIELMANYDEAKHKAALKLAS